MLTWNDYKGSLYLNAYPHDDSPLSLEEKSEICNRMLAYLLAERGEISAFNVPYEQKRNIIRGYLNERGANYIEPAILADWDRILWSETKERGIVDVNSLSYQQSIALWQGDITRLNADAIVNAANNALLGCFIPNHKCIDNVIHSAGGPQIRSDCAKIMALQGTREKTGQVKVTNAYNLPSRYVFHTVGPMSGFSVTEEQRAELKSCYLSCLDQAEEMGLSTIAFCCVSTGIFGFPNEEAAEIATGTVLNWLLRHKGKLKVIFDTFLDKDYAIYENIFKYIG